MTAVKFFLIPYDFTEMPSNSKTFIRQKSYSKSPLSPIIETPPKSSRRPSILGRSDFERLKYAIHLQFYCNSRGHVYLCKMIRVVFTHRAPDTDEKVNIMTEYPQNPRFIPVSKK
jgi:hypothetical protein